jgi:hypothetical protein
MAVNKDTKQTAEGASQQKPHAKKTTIKKGTKKTAVSIPKKSESQVDALLIENDNLKTQVAMYQNMYGELVASSSNMKMKLDILLGQILKGLYFMGITPEDILKKCSQMFDKAES